MSEARAYFAESLRRQWSFTAAHEHAKVRLRRIEAAQHRGRVAARASASGASAALSAAAFQAGLSPMSGGGGRAGRMGGGAL